MVKIIIKPDLIAPPFTFNPLKHHLGFIRRVIQEADLTAEEVEIFEVINSIGSTVTDIYCGDLSPKEIMIEVKAHLIRRSIFSRPEYEQWVWNSGKNYNFLELSDGSKWTFRKGEKTDRYVHFHPARTNGSIRVRGTTLNSNGIEGYCGRKLTTL